MYSSRFDSYATINGVKLRVDKAGRVILPKAIRDRLGLHEGSALEMLETQNGVILKTVEDRPAMTMRDGLWVHVGKFPGEFDTVQAIRDDREDRIRRLAGLSP